MAASEKTPIMRWMRFPGSRSAQRPQRLLAIRAAMLAAFAALMLWIAHAGGAPHWAMLALAALVWVAASAAPDRLPAAAHPALDTLVLTLLLHATGGHANPLVAFYLFPVLIAGLTLPRRAAAAIGLGVILAYGLLARWHDPLPFMQAMAADGAGFRLHLLGMWLTFVLVIVMLLTVVVRMSEDRRQHELTLAALRQQALRDRNMAALGAQAASDAHELGTPINTMLMMLDEWRAAPDADAARIRRMEDQLAHCRRVLARLARRAQSLAAAMPVEACETIRETIAQWRNLHPDVRVDFEAEQAAEAALAPVHAPLEQALFILLDNAREAGASRIRLHLAAAADGMLTLTCEDNGAGFAPELLAHIGARPVSGKPDGKGLGLYLLAHLLESAGGALEAGNRQDGARGALVRIRHPAVRRKKQAKEHAP